MATKGNSNRAPKNGVRYAVATAATVMTLLGAQTLAFAGKSSSSTSAQVQSTETVVAIVPTTEPVTQLNVATVSTTVAPTQVAVVTNTPTTVAVNNAVQITAATTQPQPRSQASR